MNRKILILPLLLFSLLANAEPIVRIVGTNGSGRSFAVGQVHKLVLLPNAVDVVINQGSVLMSMPLANIARVEFTDGTPEEQTAVEAIIIKEANVVKVFENGHVYILSNDKKYTIMGVEVENVQQ